MIFERRVLVFPRADFLDAMRQFAVHHNHPLPDLPPRHFQFTPEQGPVVLSITFPALPGGVVTRAVYTADEVHDALLDYCRSHHIPLPKKARKVVERYKDGAILSIQVGEPNLNVMIVDDEKGSRAHLRKSLSRINSTIIEVEETVGALSMLRAGPVDPDVIILAGKGAWNGFIRELRSDRHNRNTSKPVLVLTNSLCECEHERLLRQGATKVLHEPVGGEEIVRQIMLARGHFELAQGAVGQQQAV